MVVVMPKRKINCFRAEKQELKTSEEHMHTTQLLDTMYYDVFDEEIKASTAKNCRSAYYILFAASMCFMF